MKSLAVKYRPQNFEEVVGQESIIDILSKQIETKSFKNCYLFCGPSGDGKTTIARIFSNKVNNGIGSPIEIDAASNNGVDNIKNIVSNANERSLSSEYKVYIIDECHALTSQAWQAFLKCIEEPPKYTIFIFCTTDPQKVPNTIVNRCMRFNLSRLTPSQIYSRLYYISNSEGYNNFSDSIDYISKNCKGELRQGIALLEKVASNSINFNIDNTLSILGSLSYKYYFGLINMIIDGDEPNIIRLLSDLYSNGLNISLFVNQFINFCLDLMKYSIMHDFSILSIPKYLEESVVLSTNIKDADKYYGYVINKLLKLKNDIKDDQNPYDIVTISLLQISRCE